MNFFFTRYLFFCQWHNSRRDLALQLEIPHLLYLLNPTVHMTWADEDFIGRVARVSRRCHPRLCASRTIDRCLGLYRRQWMSKFGIKDH